MHPSPCAPQPLRPSSPAPFTCSFSYLRQQRHVEPEAPAVVARHQLVEKGHSLQAVTTTAAVAAAAAAGNTIIALPTGATASSRHGAANIRSSGCRSHITSSAITSTNTSTSRWRMGNKGHVASLQELWIKSLQVGNLGVVSDKESDAAHGEKEMLQEGKRG